MADEAWAWLPPSAQVRLAPGEVHVWRDSGELDDGRLARDVHHLSFDELARAKRFCDDRDRRRFVAARAALRLLVAGYTGIPAQMVAFEYDTGGKPRLATGGGKSPLRFNLSHSEDLRLYAFALDREVGIDVERRANYPDSDQLALRFFAPGEYARLRALPRVQRQRTFFDFWACKEAYLKATGRGIASGLDHFEIAIATDGTPRLLGDNRSPTAPSRWTLHALPETPGFAAALAVEGRSVRIACFSTSDGPAARYS